MTAMEPHGTTRNTAITCRELPRPLPGSSERITVVCLLILLPSLPGLATGGFARNWLADR
jgi:hypothetical protein